MTLIDSIPEPVTLAPHQLAWLRRPELDIGARQIWELPDGKLYSHDLHQGRLMLRFRRKRT